MQQMFITVRNPVGCFNLHRIDYNYTIPMKKILTLFLLLNTCFCTTALQAQCPGTLTLTVQSVTDADCPDNGIVVLGGTGVANPAVIFSVVSGPSRAGVQQSSNIFNSLTAGVYVFRAACNAQTAEVTVTVNNGYTPMNPAFSADVSNACTNYTAGGTITVSGVSGGHAPLQYSFIKDSVANYNDALSVYTNNNSYAATSWGTYQVRVKDACGIYLTKTVNIQRSYEPATFSGANVSFENEACDSAGLWFWLQDDARLAIGTESYPKLRFRVFEKQAGSCAPGLLIKSFEMLSSSSNYFVIPRRDVFVEITTPCGDVRTNCYDYPDNDSLQTVWQPIVKGCGTGADPYTLTIQHLHNYFTKLPAGMKLYNNTTNTLVQSSVITTNSSCCVISNLPLDNYRIEVTDACNHSDTVLIIPPSGPASILPADAGSIVDRECSFENGKTTIKLGLTGIASNLDISTITITSGPDNVGQSATMNSQNGLFYFFNVTPGATYGFALNNGCSSVNLSFVVPTEDWRILHFTISPFVTQQCGGSGTINAGVNYNGWGAYKSELWQGGVKIGENNSGIFTNLAPGLYTVKGIGMQSWCPGVSSKELSDTIRVYDDATPPQLLRQFGFICESSGAATAFGSASIEVAGVGPFSYALKQISPSSDSNYTTVATNAPGNYTFTHLVAYAVYSLLITDNCGKSTVSELVVGNIGSLYFTNPYEPCTGNPYLLSAFDIPGATYSWVKHGDATVLSTSKDLYFSSYNAAYNGQYDCTLTVGGSCLQRTLSAQLNSTNCGSVLPLKLHAFYATAQYCKVQLNWVTAGAGAGVFEIERSTDGSSFYTAGTVSYNSNTAAAYSFNDEPPLNGIVYYRLKMTGRDGRTGYSKQLMVANRCMDKNMRIAVYPNPVTNNNAVVTIYADHGETADVYILNTSGQILSQTKAAVRRGEMAYVLDMSAYASGYYFIKVNSASGFTQTVKVYRQ